jgi:hypothetical protein
VILPEPPEPKYWKALVPALIVAIPVALFFHAVIRGSPLWLWLALGIAFAMAGAYSMQMNFSHIDRATSVPPNVRIRDK